MTAAAAALLLAPSGADAQICLGNPAQERGGAVSGTAHFNGGPTSYGGEFHGNLEGPAAVGLNFMLTDLEGVEEDIYSFGASVAYDIAVETPRFALCPTAAVQYSRWEQQIEDFDADSRSEFRFPVGLALGTEMGDRDRAALIPAVTGGWFYYTERDPFEGDELDDPDLARDDSGGEFFAELSAALATGPFYVRGAVLTDPWRVDDPVYRLSLGLAF